MPFNMSAFGGYLPLLVAITVLSIDAVIEVGMVGAMVGFLHDRAGKFFTIDAPSGSFDLHGKPAGLLVDQGHTSNGAAGTAFVLVGWLGYLVIFYERRRARRVCIWSFLFQVASTNKFITVFSNKTIRHFHLLGCHDCSFQHAHPCRLDLHLCSHK